MERERDEKRFGNLDFTLTKRLKRFILDNSNNDNNIITLNSITNDRTMIVGIMMIMMITITGGNNYNHIDNCKHNNEHDKSVNYQDDN